MTFLVLFPFSNYMFGMFGILFLCDRLFLGRHVQLSTHPRQGTDNKQKYGYHQGPNGEPMSFISVTSRARNYSKAAVLSKATPAWVTTHQRWKPRAHCTPYSQCNRLENVLSKVLCWSGFIPGNSASFWFFSAVRVLSASCRWLRLSLKSWFFIHSCGGRISVWSVSGT